MLNEIIQGTIALQTFAANAKYVEMIVDIAFAVVPTILGLGAAGLIGNSAIRTAKDVMGSISVLQNLGPGLRAGMGLGWMAGKGLGKGVRIGLDKAAERWPSLKSHPITRPFFKPPKEKGGEKQNTQGKQEGQGGGGGGGSPPTPPDIKTSEKKEERPKPTGIETYSPIDVLNPFKKKE